MPIECDTCFNVVARPLGGRERVCMRVGALGRTCSAAVTCTAADRLSTRDKKTVLTQSLSLQCWYRDSSDFKIFLCLNKQYYNDDDNNNYN